MSSVIRSIVLEALNVYQLPGLAIAINQDQTERLAAGFGNFDARASRPVDADTIFGVASLSKLVTSILILMLAEKRELSLDDLLVTHYPNLTVPGNAPIRLKHLLSHTAGFPGLPGRFHAHNIDDPNDRSGGVDQSGSGLQEASVKDASQLVDLINALNTELLAAPGEQISYSNEGFCLLGGIVEKIVQRPYSVVAHDWVFAPLSMRHSFVGGIDLTESDNVAFPLLRESSGFRRSKFWQAPLFYPAGGCVSSARDMVRLISVLNASSDLLSTDSQKQLMTSQALVASRPDGRSGYGYGLEVQTIDSETTLVWHSGQRAGISSFMGWLVEEQLAISVLANVGGVPVTSIAHQLIGAWLNRPDIAWPSLGSKSHVVEDYHHLVGRYETDEGNRVLIERTNNEWVMTQQTGSTPMRFLTKDSGVVGDQTFRFMGADADSDHGLASALALDLRVLPRALSA